MTSIDGLRSARASDLQGLVSEEEDHLMHRVEGAEQGATVAASVVEVFARNPDRPAADVQ